MQPPPTSNLIFIHSASVKSTVIIYTLLFHCEFQFSSVQFLFLKSVVKEVYKKEIKHYFKSYH